MKQETRMLIDFLEASDDKEKVLDTSMRLREELGSKYYEMINNQLLKCKKIKNEYKLLNNDNNEALDLTKPVSQGMVFIRDITLNLLDAYSHAKDCDKKDMVLLGTCIMGVVKPKELKDVYVEMFISGLKGGFDSQELKEMKMLSEKAEEVGISADVLNNSSRIRHGAIRECVGLGKGSGNSLNSQRLSNDFESRVITEDILRSNLNL